tara:strand:- start:43342 stop:43950 length:609 start_codon:yes stop_codon:yes gene_type:complete
MNKNKFIKKMSILIIIAISIFGQLNAKDTNPSNWVENIGNLTLSILEDKKTSDTNKEIFLEQIFMDNLDIKRISLFILGPYRRNLDKKNSEEYFNTIKSFISEVYAKRLLSFPAGKIQITKNEDRGKRGTIIYSSIQFENRPNPVSIDWWVISNKLGNYKVFDIRISGIWMAQEQRSTFTSFLSKNNGDIKILIKKLEQQIG